MKNLLVILLLAAGLKAPAQENIKNVLKDIPYTDTGIGKRQLVSDSHLFVMQAALRPGQQVPLHNANSSVHLLILEGRVAVTLNETETAAVKGDLIPVACGTPMSIRNNSETNASFLILKTPNPNALKQ